MNLTIATCLSLLVAGAVLDDIDLEGVACPVTGEPARAQFKLSYQGGEVYLSSGAAVEALMSDNAGFFSAKANRQLVETGQAIQVFCPVTGRLTDLESVHKVAGIRVAHCSRRCHQEFIQGPADGQFERIFGSKGFKRS